jgi:hypothetical protein
MARLLCSCGHVIDDSSDSHYDKARYIPDARWNEFWIAVDNAIENSGPSIKDKDRACMELRQMRAFRAMHQCINCGALQIEGQDNTLHEFSAKRGTKEKTLFDIDGRTKDS